MTAHTTGTRRRTSLLAVVLGLLCTVMTTPVATSAPTWRPVTTLSDPTYSSGGFAIASDPSGNSVAVWSQSNGTYYVVRAATHLANGTWTEPVTISDPAVGAGSPDVAIEADGDAVAVWVAGPGLTQVVQSATAPLGGTWSPPAPVSGTGEVGDPRVAVSPTGHATAVWLLNGTSIIVQTSSRPAGGGWDAPVDLSAAGRNAFTPDVDVDPAGRATAVWRRTNDAMIGVIQARSRSLAGVWSATDDLSLATNTARQPRVAVDPMGNANVIWTRFNGQSDVVQAAHKLLGGAWSPYQPISPGGEEANLAQIVVSPAGDATAIWYGIRDTTAVVQVAFHPLNGFWGPAVDLSDTSTGALDPAIAVDPTGTATAVWRGVGGKVQASRRPAFGVWSPRVDVSDGTFAVDDLQVVVGGTGDALAAWEARLGVGTYRIQLAALDVAAPTITSFAAPANARAGALTPFAATASDTWSPVSYAWSFGDGTSATGTSVTHKFAKAGTYRVRLTVTDAVGNSASRSVDTVVRLRPSLKVFRLSDATIRRGHPTVLTVRLNVKATVRVVFRGQHKGLKAVLQRRLPKGTSRIKITTWVGGKTLVPDSYVLTGTATNAGGTSRKKTLSLKVLR